MIHLYKRVNIKYRYIDIQMDNSVRSSAVTDNLGLVRVRA